jgi:uncharacterized protein (TIGR02099 family)
MLTGFLLLTNIIWRLIFLALVFLSLSASLLLAMFHALPHYPDLVEDLASQILATPVQLTRLNTTWQNSMPTLVLHDVHLSSEHHTQQISELQIRLNLIASILERQLVSETLLLVVERIDTKTSGGDSGFAITSEQQAWLDWLLQQHQVEVQIQRLNLHQAETVQTLSNLRVVSVREGLHHRFHIQADLSPQTWLNARGYQLQRGQVELNALASWANNELIGLRGDVGIEQLDVIGAENKKDEVDRLYSRFSLYQAERQSWKLDVKDFSARVNGIAPQAIHFGFSQVGKVGLKLRLESVYLARWLALLGGLQNIPTAWRNALSVMQPQAQLAYLEWQHKRGNWDLSLAVKHWQNRAWLHWPGLQSMGFSARLYPEGGDIAFDQHNVSVALPTLYSTARQLQSLQGKVRWERNGAGWHIHSDKAIRLSTDAISELALSGFVRLPDAGEPHADLQLKFSDMPLSRVYAQLPNQRISAKTLAWLKTHLQGGRVSQAQGILRGPLRALPFKHGEGVLRLDARIEDGRVLYGDKWPSATHVVGDFRITGQDIEMYAKRGKILDNPIAETTISIKNFTSKAAVVRVSGHSQTDAASALSFVEASPLNLKLDFLQATGPIRLDLNVAVPLRKGRQADVDGVIHFNKTAVGEKNTGLMLNNAQGAFIFDENSFRTDKVRGDFFGQATSLNVYSSRQADAATFLEMRGTADKALLQKLFLHLDKQFPYLKWLQNMSGQTAWRADLQLPKHATRDAVLNIQSDLYGLRTGLPEPLAKQAHQRRALKLDVALSKNTAGREIKIRYADILQAIWYAGRKPLRGAVQFGTADTLSLPLQGLHIQGKIQRFPFTAWQALWPTHAEEGEAQPLSLNLHIAQLELLGHYFHTARLYSQGKTAQKIYLQAQEISGTLQRYPDKLAIDLSHLVLRENAQLSARAAAAGEALNPTQVPALQVTCQDTYVHGIDLGALAFATRPVKDGMELSEIRLQTADTQIEGRGYWLNVSGGQRTMLHVKLDSSDVVATLQRFGFAEQPLVSKQARLELSGSWKGRPTQFKLKELTGDLRLDIAKGRLIQVEPGVGRIFGLFDLRVMPSRLVLDFNDLFAEGFSFVSMRGDFTFAKGFADTDNLTIHSNAADVYIYGRTGLEQRNFDQIVTIIPKASNALPIAGALLGGVGGGVAMWLVQQAVQDPIDQSLQIMYQVTGEWNSPVVTRLGKVTQSEEGE